MNWGIVGCGDVTEGKSGPGFQKAEGSELVAVMRRDGAKARDYARRHGVQRAYDRAADLIADPQVDAVYVATPPSTHAELALAGSSTRRWRAAGCSSIWPRTASTCSTSSSARSPRCRGSPPTRVPPTA